MKKIQEALAWARATYTPLGSLIDQNNWEKQHAIILADEIDRLRAVVQRCGICRDATHAPPYESVDAENKRLQNELTRAYCRMNEAAELLEQNQATVVDAARRGAVVVLRSALAVRTTKGLIGS